MLLDCSSLLKDSQIHCSTVLALVKDCICILRCQCHNKTLISAASQNHPSLHTATLQPASVIRSAPLQKKDCRNDFSMEIFPRASATGIPLSKDSHLPKDSLT